MAPPKTSEGGGGNMSFGPTQNVMNVIMNERVINKFQAILTVSWSRKVKFRACGAAIPTSTRIM